MPNKKAKTKKRNKRLLNKKLQSVGRTKNQIKKRKIKNARKVGS